MFDFLNILAETDPPWGKFVGVAFVVLVWIIGILAQAAKKGSEKSKQRKPPKLDEEIARRLPPPAHRPTHESVERASPRPDWDIIAEQQPSAPHPKPPHQAPRPKQRPGKVPSRVAPPPIPTARQTFAQTPVQPQEVPRTSPQAVAPSEEQPRPASPFVDARALRRWVRPATLRQQFILTELFQPPLSMREGQSRL